MEEQEYKIKNTCNPQLHHHCYASTITYWNPSLVNMYIFIDISPKSLCPHSLALTFIVINFLFINPFAPNAPFLYSLKTLENLTVSWCFQGVEKGSIGNKWVKETQLTHWIPMKPILKYHWYGLNMNQVKHEKYISKVLNKITNHVLHEISLHYVQ